MNIAHTTTDYYFTNIEQLTDSTQFHFASRLYAWNKDPRALHLLEKLKPWMLEPSQNKELFKKFASELLSSPPEAKINASQVRNEYFQKYPELRSIDFILFRLRHLKSVYGLDISDYLTDLLSHDELYALGKKLSQDEAAVRILSTYAVNYFYLLEIVLNIKIVSPDYYLEVAKKYNLQDLVHLQLFIYLFTHCIIGASNFYTQAVPKSDLPKYLEMLTQLEAVIKNNYQAINLDNKFEFLVCCRICNYESDLFDAINAEAAGSVSTEGMFLIDRHNQNNQSNKTSLQDSEHRNVLYIMAQSAYPHTNN